MSGTSEPREVARRVLPWVLLPRFLNVVTRLPLPERLEPGKTYVVRELELYVTNDAGVYVPGASTLLVVPHLSYRTERDEAERVVRVLDIEGSIYGFMPDGTPARYRASTIVEKEGIPEIRYGDRYSDFSLDVVLRNALRLSAGKYFAYKVESAMRRRGVFFSRGGVVKMRNVVVRERGVVAEIPLTISLYTVTYRGERLRAPGVVPGVLDLIGRGLLETVGGEARTVLDSFLERVSSVGKRLSPVSGAILHRTSRTRFHYYIGEVSASESVVRALRSREGDRVWLAGGPMGKGTGAWVTVYADLRNMKAYAAVSLLPLSTPAAVVLNYPPFSIAPLSALMGEGSGRLGDLLERAGERARRLGLDVGFYDRDLAVLADAGIGFREVKQILRDGYPRLEHLEPVLEKTERLGDIGDIMSMALGPVYKVDKLLVTLAEPVREERSRVAEEKEEVLL